MPCRVVPRVVSCLPPAEAADVARAGRHGRQARVVPYARTCHHRTLPPLAPHCACAGLPVLAWLASGALAALGARWCLGADAYTSAASALTHTLTFRLPASPFTLHLPCTQRPAAFGSTIKAMLRLLAAALPPTVARLHGHAEGSGPLSETLYGSVAVGTSGGGSPGQPGVTHGSATAATAAAAAAAAVKGLLDLLPGSVWAVLVGWAAAHAALVFMTGGCRREAAQEPRDGGLYQAVMCQCKGLLRI